MNNEKIQNIIVELAKVHEKLHSSDASNELDKAFKHLVKAQELEKEREDTIK